MHTLVCCVPTVVSCSFVMCFSHPDTGHQQAATSSFQITVPVQITYLSPLLRLNLSEVGGPYSADPAFLNRADADVFSRPRSRSTGHGRLPKCCVRVLMRLNSSVVRSLEEPRANRALHCNEPTRSFTVHLPHAFWAFKMQF